MPETVDAHVESSDTWRPWLGPCEALELARRGADEVGLRVSPAAPGAPSLGEFCDWLTAIAETTAPLRTRTRVVFDGDGLDGAAVAAWCEAFARAEVRLVQGGIWRSARAEFHRMTLMRAALPREVLLKWTHPVRSLNVLLLCLAEGMDRYNGDVEQLLAQLREPNRAAPVQVPEPGVDY
jgi:deoxyribose-phosphate aldolase